MKSRWLIAALPVVVCVAAYAALQSLVGRGAEMGGVYRMGALLARVAAAAGCAIAAAQFDRGDHMRKAWITLSVAFGILVVNALLFGAASHMTARSLSSVAEVGSGVLVAAANLAMIAGELGVARTWNLAGLDLQVSKPVRTASFVGSLVIALVIVGGTAWGDVHQVAQGHYDALSSLGSDLGDVVSLAVLAPILLTALALRGGTLAWPWGLIVVGTLAWLLADGSGAVAAVLEVSPSAVKPLEQAFQMAGCVAYLSAGLLQRRARLALAVSAAPAAA